MVDVDTRITLSQNPGFVLYSILGVCVSCQFVALILDLLILKHLVYRSMPVSPEVFFYFGSICFDFTEEIQQSIEFWGFVF